MFTAPLLVWIRPAKGQALVKRVCDVDAGIAVLTRDGLGEYGCHIPEWHLALTALSRAKVEPTPENLEAARLALRTVALQSGSLLDG
jgi:hypothetical protein